MKIGRKVCLGIIAPMFVYAAGQIAINKLQEKKAENTELSDKNNFDNTIKKKEKLTKICGIMLYQKMIR